MDLAHFDANFKRQFVTVKSAASCDFSFFPPRHSVLLLLGIIRTAVPDMDRESRDEYLVVLQAKDMGGHLGGLSGTTTVTVKLTDVNDNPPHFRRSKCCCYHVTLLLLFSVSAAVVCDLNE